MTAGTEGCHRWYAERRSSRYLQCVACGREAGRHDAMTLDEECPEYDPDRVYFGADDPDHDWQFLFWNPVSDGIHATEVNVGIFQCSRCGQYMTRLGSFDESKTHPRNVPKMCDFMKAEAAG